MSTDSTERSFGTSLRTARELAGLSQEDLALRSGLSRSYITNLESERKNNPRLDAMTRLARAMGLTVGELLRCL